MIYRGSKCGVNCQNPTKPYTANNSLGNGTSYYMGPIHFRPKQFAGDRMARQIAKYIYGYDNLTFTGPVISGCNFQGNNKVIIVNFNQTLMNGEQLFYQPFDAWYNQSLTVEYQNAIEINDGGKWVHVNDSYVKTNSKNAEVTIDVSSFYDDYGQQDIKGIRYAWSDTPCCGNLNNNENPCPMNMCPFQTEKSRLPAVPFWAKIVNNKCECFAPQNCTYMTN